MTEEKKRAVAYIAARLVTQQAANSVFDLTENRHYQFQGEVSAETIQVFDQERNSQITAVLLEGSYRLYDHYSQEFIHLTLKEKGKFQGQDAQMGTQFSGTVTGKLVTLYDYANSTNSRYEIEQLVS